MILFSAIDHKDCLDAHRWHREFAGANDAIYPRPFDEFEQLVMEGSVWAARDTNGGYLALAYANFDEAKKECEVGGLMVVEHARNRGLGGIMMRLALIHMLIEENLLADPDVRVVAHVLKSNPMPRGIIERQLRFRHHDTLEIPGEHLPGLRTEEDGKVHGDEFILVKPDSLLALAEWARGWTGRLANDEIADVDLRQGVTIEDWRQALDALAASFPPEQSPPNAAA